MFQQKMLMEHIYIQNIIKIYLSQFTGKCQINLQYDVTDIKCYDKSSVFHYIFFSYKISFSELFSCLEQGEAGMSLMMIVQSEEC